MRAEDARKVEEDLEDLERKLQRLKVEYDQFFLGGLKREPTVLRGEVQRTIAKYVNEPPRNSMHKFKFNTLSSRYQSLRVLWGRTLRSLEAGTHPSQRFRPGRPAEAREEADAAVPEAAAVAPSPPPSPVDRLIDALESARRAIGDGAVPLDRTKLREAILRQQAELLRQHPGQRVVFRVAIENNRAKLLAALRAPHDARHAEPTTSSGTPTPF